MTADTLRAALLLAASRPGGDAALARLLGCARSHPARWRRRPTSALLSPEQLATLARVVADPSLLAASVRRAGRPRLGAEARTWQIRVPLTAAEMERTRAAAEGHPRGLFGWLADALRAWVAAPGKAARVPAGAKAVALETEPEAVEALDRVTGGEERGGWARAAVLRGLRK